MTRPLKDKLHAENIYNFITLAIPHMITEQFFTVLGSGETTWTTLSSKRCS